MHYKENGNCYSPFSEDKVGYWRAKMICDGNYVESILISEVPESILSFLTKDEKEIPSFWVNSAKVECMRQLLNSYKLKIFYELFW